jgi:hypothetical protein
MDFGVVGALIVVGIDVFLQPFVCNVANYFSVITPGVDHGVACTWHWNSAKYLEPIGECVGFIQRTGWLCWLRFAHAMILLVWTQGIVQHPWDQMVEIPTPPKRGCGQLSYVWICCNCA